MQLLSDALRTHPLDDEPTDVTPKPPKPLAVVVLSSREYLADPAVNPWVAPFYEEVQQILQEQGFDVDFDTGEPYTRPDTKAYVWVGHDLGCKRFHRAPHRMRLVRLETQAAYEDFPDNDTRRRNQANYLLSERDRERLRALKPTQQGE